MGLFNSKSKVKSINIHGYIIDKQTGTLINVPKGLKVYTIPKEVKKLNGNLSLVENKVLAAMSKANKIVFEDGSVDEIPERYFTFGATFKDLKEIILPNGIKKLGNHSIDPIRTIYNSPITLEHLGKDMYPVTQKLVIGNNITSLADSFATHDTNLVHVEVHGSIKELPIFFVNQCKNIKTLILHEGVETAGKDAFRNLNSLEYVELPDSFNCSFETSMEAHPGSSPRGNNSYSGVDTFLENIYNTLTIKKIYNGITYTFQVRRGDFKAISFKNTTALIKSSIPLYKDINIDLSKINPNVICQINIRKSQIKQTTSQQQTPTQEHNQSQPTQSQPSNNTSSSYSLQGKRIMYELTILEQKRALLNDDLSKNDDKYSMYHEKMRNLYSNLENRYLEILNLPPNLQTIDECIAHYGNLEITPDQKKALRGIRSNPGFQKLMGENALASQRNTLQYILGYDLKCYYEESSQIIIKSCKELDSEFQGHKNKLDILVNNGRITEDKYAEYGQLLNDIFGYFYSYAEGKQIPFMKISDHEIKEIKKQAQLNGVSETEMLRDIISDKYIFNEFQEIPYTSR